MASKFEVGVFKSTTSKFEVVVRWRDGEQVGGCSVGAVACKFVV